MSYGFNPKPLTHQKRHFDVTRENMNMDSVLNFKHNIISNFDIHQEMDFFLDEPNVNIENYWMFREHPECMFKRL